MPQKLLIDILNKLLPIIIKFEYIIKPTLIPRGILHLELQHQNSDFVITELERLKVFSTLYPT